MNIQELKAAIATKAGIASIGTLTMVRQLDENQQNTPWLSHWDNDNRVRVTMHEEVMASIKGDPNTAVAFKHEVVEAHPDKDGTVVAAYQRFVVITPRNVEATF